MGVQPKHEHLNKTLMFCTCKSNSHYKEKNCMKGVTFIQSVPVLQVENCTWPLILMYVKWTWIWKWAFLIPCHGEVGKLNGEQTFICCVQLSGTSLQSKCFHTRLKNGFKRTYIVLTVQNFGITALNYTGRLFRRLIAQLYVIQIVA